jgi:hypothetical protein
MQAHGDVCNIAGGIGNVGGNAGSGIGRVGLSFCTSKNDSSNKESPCKVGTSPEKSGD